MDMAIVELLVFIIKLYVTLGYLVPLLFVV